jgi:hypothetical protein
MAAAIVASDVANSKAQPGKKSGLKTVRDAPSI